MAMILQQAEAFSKAATCLTVVGYFNFTFHCCAKRLKLNWKFWWNVVWIIGLQWTGLLDYNVFFFVDEISRESRPTENLLTTSCIPLIHVFSCAFTISRTQLKLLIRNLSSGIFNLWSFANSSKCLLVFLNSFILKFHLDSPYLSNRNWF